MEETLELMEWVVRRTLITKRLNEMESEIRLLGFSRAVKRDRHKDIDEMVSNNRMKRSQMNQRSASRYTHRESAHEAGGAVESGFDPEAEVEGLGSCFDLAASCFANNSLADLSNCN